MKDANNFIKNDFLSSFLVVYGRSWLFTRITVIKKNKLRTTSCSQSFVVVLNGLKLFVVVHSSS